MAEQKLSEDQQRVLRLMEMANSIQGSYMVEHADVLTGIDTLATALVASYAQLMEVGINLGIREPDKAREILSSIEFSRTNCQHPKDEYCVPHELLMDIYRVIIKDEWPEDGKLYR